VINRTTARKDNMKNIRILKRMFYRGYIVAQIDSNIIKTPNKIRIIRSICVILSLKDAMLLAKLKVGLEFKAVP
jgi:hypothetical protein